MDCYNGVARRKKVTGNEEACKFERRSGLSDGWGPVLVRWWCPVPVSAVLSYCTPVLSDGGVTGQFTQVSHAHCYSGRMI